MRINSEYKHRFFWAVIILAAFIFTYCKKNEELGMGILPSSDLISVKNKILKDEISAFTVREDSVRTDAASKSLLGSYNDPVFGNTTIDFAAQFRLPTYPDFGADPVADSIFLYLYYRNIYGDTLTTQHIKVYELEQGLVTSETDSTGGSSSYPYYQNVDLKSMASDKLLGELEFVPKFRLDSTGIDTLYQLMRIPLDISLAEKLISADSLQMVSNDVFLNYFKGLYIEAEKVTGEGGTILSLEAASNSSFQGSALVMYYNNDSNLIADPPDTLNMPYIITGNSARVNHFEHDYTGTPFFGGLNSATSEDSLIYMQSTGGLEAKINIDNLTDWKDSLSVSGGDTVRYGINKAELVFQIDTVASELDKYPPPDRLRFLYIQDDGQVSFPKDYSFSQAFYDGTLNPGDYTYRFNITQHIQEIIDGKINNNGFKLTTANKNSEANRVILKGSSSNNGIKLIITYSKFLLQ